ncbi:uncharacterized protein LOC126269384 [Schistocerca gregaria]|uniref:uncharacterized protein LOC126269384 n=1 Tax=Schistocerca gregaria TaxID=7010 RepID=UPI00211ECC67|nr:uncharacterized protein LOC126269384 [Schistocerca gregaria]
MARLAALSCVLASVVILATCQTEDTRTTQTAETDEDHNTSELTAPLTVPSFHSEDQKTKESTSTTPKETIETTTTPPTTTSRPTTTEVPRTNSLFRFRGKDGATCILLQVDALLSIKYKTISGEMRDRDIYVPNKANISGSCNEDTSYLDLTWPSFFIRWSFSKTPGGERWYINKLELQYTLSSEIFEHVANPGQTVQVSTAHSHENMLYPTLVGRSFTCKQELTVHLSGEHAYGATLYLRDLRLQPFIFNVDDFSPEYECSPGGITFRDETAPIAVGSTLAIVVLLTVTGYGIYRYFKIKKVQYDTME